MVHVRLSFESSNYPAELWTELCQPFATCFANQIQHRHQTKQHMFLFLFTVEGVSHLPCSDLYCGSSGGSEPEVQAVSQEMVRISADVLAMVTVYSYAYMWLFPWGNSVDYAGQVCQRSDDHDELVRGSFSIGKI